MSDNVQKPEEVVVEQEQPDMNPEDVKKEAAKKSTRKPTTKRGAKPKKVEPDENEQPVTEETEATYNIPRIAMFHKVSFETFLQAFKPMWLAVQKDQMGIDQGEAFAYKEEELIAAAELIYSNIRKPRRATKGSAGYDFFFPFGATELPPGVSTVIPTGVKVEMAEGWVLKEYPRSSLGFNYRIQLDNTVGIIDSDYFNNPKNEGHIMIKITNDSKDGYTCCLNIGDAFCQGIFVPFGITVDDDTVEERTG